MHILSAYLRQRWGLIAALVASTGLLLLSFALFRLNISAVIYPALLSAAVWAAFFLVDFVRFRRKHRCLSALANLPSIVLEPRLFPEAETLEDQDYQAIIQNLRQEQTRLQTKMNLRYDNMVEYYTTWAHQIKTPIASMRLNLQGEDTPLSHQLNTDLLRVEQYVEMVLVFLRLDSDSTDYVFKSCDLDTILRNAVKKFADEFIRRRLKLNYQPLNVSVVTDQKWLSFVVEQLLSNALKYTPSGSITIYLEPKQTLCIRDTGIGIAPEDMPRIFEKGFTGYNGRQHQSASGIGLYLCKRVCTNLGHELSLTSSPERGTTVRLNLYRTEQPRE
ncbi:MAG: sensor histidine kinase [Oscillospiraceae bacterium]|nr:sensor histidine kinase [Oscillospiraceae bacterium]